MFPLGFHTVFTTKLMLLCFTWRSKINRKVNCTWSKMKNDVCHNKSVISIENSLLWLSYALTDNRIYMSAKLQKIFFNTGFVRQMTFNEPYKNFRFYSFKLCNDPDFCFYPFVHCYEFIYIRSRNSLYSSLTEIIVILLHFSLIFVERQIHWSCLNRKGKNKRIFNDNR